MKINCLLKHKLVPQGTVDITNDKILFFDGNFLVTQWKPENSNMNISSAISLVSIKDGYQISKKFDSNNKFVYWYCDIVKTKWTKETSCLEITDLIIDLVVFPNYQVNCIDLDELTDAKEKGLISSMDFNWAKESSLKLLQKVIEGEFPSKANLKSIIEFIPKNFFEPID